MLYVPVRKSLVPVVLVVDGVGSVGGAELVMFVAVIGDIGELLDTEPVPYEVVTNGGPG